jgi:hypothetical protein
MRSQIEVEISLFILLEELKLSSILRRAIEELN